MYVTINESNTTIYRTPSLSVTSHGSRSRHLVRQVGLRVLWQCGVRRKPD